MDHEHPDAVYYDSEKNTRFSEALAESIVIPAYFTAIHQAVEAGIDANSNMVTADCEYYDEGERVGFDLFALRDQNTIYITSTLYKKVKEISFAGALTIHDEILHSTIHDDVKERYGGKADKLYATAKIETFVRRTFKVIVTDKVISAHVNVSLGYCVDELEITYPNTDDEAATELDQQFVKSFDKQDIYEIIWALLGMELIDDTDVRRFLDQEF